MKQDVVVSHDFRNWLHTVLLLGSMLALLALLGWLVGGQTGVLWALILGGILVIFGQQVSPQLVLRMYRARPLSAAEAPELYQIMAELARRAQLPFVPVLYYIPSQC